MSTDQSNTQQEDLVKNNIPVGVIRLKKVIPIISYARITENTFYNSTVREVAIFHKPTSQNFSIATGVK